MAKIALFHSVMGLRKNILKIAERLREAGHVVYTPDLFSGKIFDDMDTALMNLKETGFPEIINRACNAVHDLPHDLVYAGFSMGGVCAEYLALKRSGAKGCLLFHSALPVQAFEKENWPQEIPLQIHFALYDPWRKEEAIEKLIKSASESGADCQKFDYNCKGHLFADWEHPDYHEQSAERMFQESLLFLKKSDELNKNE